MMEPRFERARVLGQAIDVAAHTLVDPIEKIILSDQAIFVFAGRERLELSYAYYDAYTQDGSVMPGSGHWSVQLVKSTKLSWFRRLSF
jgi:hypothetical protein